MAWLMNINVPLYKDYEVTPKFRELGIKRGYRSEKCSPLQCIASVFRLTNETANFWTHFIPSLYFTWQLLSLLCDNIPDECQFLVYMTTVVTYLWVSCIAHAFSCMSSRAQDVCYFMDYLALSVFGYGTALLYLTYSFPQDLIGSRFEIIYPIACLISSTTCTVTSCYSRTMTTIGHSCMYVRIGAYIVHYLCVNFPLFYRIVWEGWQNEASGLYFNSQFVAMGLAVFFYGTHLPERVAPGKFDYVGNSHNLLHVCGVMGTELQRRAVLADMEARRSHITPPISGNVTLAAVLFDAIINAVVVVIFIKQLNKTHTKHK